MPRFKKHQFLHLIGCISFSLLWVSTMSAQETLYRILKTDQKAPNIETRSGGTSTQNSCNCIGEVPGDLVICENFQEYAQGPITPQSNDWFLWPGATRDGYVDASGSNQFLRLKHDNGAESDVLLDLGNRTSGRYHLSFRLWTWEGYSGYYNIQHNSNFSTSSQANWAYHVQFINGQGNVRIGSFNAPLATTTFSYTPNAWNYVTQIIDLDNDEIELEINGTRIGSWQFSLGSRGIERRLGALDFYAREEFNAQFVIDNICLIRTDGDNNPPEEANLACLDRGQIRIDDVQLSLNGVKVINEGPGSTAPTNFGYYLSTNYNFTTKDYLIASEPIPALSPGESYSFNLDMDLRDANVPDDFYYLGYIIDYEDKIAETNEEDNNDCYWTNIRFQYITTNRLPNLVCAGRGQYDVQQQLLSIKDLSVENQGSGDAGASSVGVYLSSNTNITASDFLLGSIPLEPLEEGDIALLDFQVRLDTFSNLTPGDYYLGFFIDHINAVKESNGDDNTCVWTNERLTVGPAVDLTANLSCQNAGNLIIAGTDVNILDLEILNLGDTASGTFELGFYLSENTNFTTSDFLVHTYTIDDIAAESSTTLDLSFALNTQNIPPGDYYMGVIIDHLFEVEESDNSDNSSCNWLAETINIEAPIPATCNCTDPSKDFICEDFDIYSEGFFSSQSVCFENASGISGSDDDGVITRTQAFSGDRSLGIRENGQANAKFMLGDKEAGTYTLEWMMFVPLQKSAQYKLEGQALFGETNKLNVTFGNSTRGKGFISNSGTSFDYPEAQWFKVRHTINMDQNYISVHINDELVLNEWPFYFGLEFVQFLSTNANSTYFIDDFLYDLLFIVQDGRVQTSAWEGEYLAQSAPHDLQVFPNPVSDRLQVELQNQSGLPVIFQLHNELGQLVWQERFPADPYLRTQIPMAAYQQGLYLLSLQTGTHRQTQKIIVR